jgi:hypothetical protein
MCIHHRRIKSISRPPCPVCKMKGIFLMIPKALPMLNGLKIFIDQSSPTMAVSKEDKFKYA